MGFRLVPSSWGRGSRSSRPTPHRHRGSAIVPHHRLRLGGDGVHIVTLEVPPEDERYRQRLDHEEVILHGCHPDVDGQGHLRVHIEQLPRCVPRLGPGRRPRRVIAPPLGQHIRADHTGTGARVDHRPRRDGGCPRRQLVRLPNLKILVAEQQQRPVNPRAESPTTATASGRDGPRRAYPRGGKRDTTGDNRGVGAHRGDLGGRRGHLP